MEKFPQRRNEGEEDNGRSTLNKTFSERRLPPRKEEEDERDYNYRQDEKPGYDNYRKDYRGEYNLVKKRSEHFKPYYNSRKY